MKVRWSQRAARQLAAIVKSLEDVRPGAGRRFHEAVRSIVSGLSSRPAMYPRIPGMDNAAIHRALVRRFRYWLIFEIHDSRDEVVVLTLWHVRRSPPPLP